EQQAAGEAGDEAAAAERLRGGETQGGQSNDRDVQPVLAGPAEACGAAQHEDGGPRDDDAGEQADAEFLDDDHGDVRGGGRMDLGADGEVEQDDDERHADAVVQAGLEVERLARGFGDGGVGDDGRAERGVGRREERGEQRDPEQVELREDEQPDEEAEHDGDRQADQQQPFGQGDGAPDHGKVGVRGVAEQHHREGELRQRAQVGGGDRQTQRVETGGAEDQSGGGEQDGPAEPGASDPPGGGAVKQHHGGEDGGVFVHAGRSVRLSPS